MTVTTDPRFNFQWGFAPGDAGWGTPYNYQTRALSSLVGLYLLSESSLAPPVSPADGDSYFVNTGAASGDWTGQADHIASWQGGAWQFYPAAKGLRAYIEDLAGFYYWSGAGWVVETAGATGGSTITSINGYTTGVIVLTVTDISGAAPLSDFWDHNAWAHDAGRQSGHGRASYRQSGGADLQDTRGRRSNWHQQALRYCCVCRRGFDGIRGLPALDSPQGNFYSQRGHRHGDGERRGHRHGGHQHRQERK
jgi:hypothetical protein